MLTFFEYLRQRAFESVMAGAYDALELLEAKKSLEEPKEKLPPPRTVSYTHLTLPTIYSV